MRQLHVHCLVSLGLLSAACNTDRPTVVNCAGAALCGAGGLEDDGLGGTTDPGSGGNQEGNGGTGGSGGSEGDTSPHCSPDLSKRINDGLATALVGLGFGNVPALEKGPVGGNVTQVGNGSVELETDDGVLVALQWPEGIPLGFQSGDRVEASRTTQGWDILRGDTTTVALYLEDTFTGPDAIGGLPGGPTLGLAPACKFADTIGTECGRAPVETSTLLDLSAGDQLIPMGESAEVGGWRIWNLHVTQQDGFMVGSCAVEPWFVGVVAAVSGAGGEAGD